MWRMSRKRKDPVTPPETTGERAADEAVAISAEQLKTAKEKHSSIAQVAKGLAELRRENHFAEMLREAFGGSK